MGGKKLIQDKSIFASYFSMEEEEEAFIAAFAKEICTLLQTPPIMTQG